MAKKTKDITEEQEPEDQIESLLNHKDAKGKHYGARSGTEIMAVDKISTGSYLFDEFLDGGFRSSCWARFYAAPESGKTSMSLCWGKQWQDFYKDQGMVVFFNAEGRITPDIVERSGINTNKSQFRIIDSNRADFIWDMIESLIQNNPDKLKYFFIVDSTDACIRDVDNEKAIGDGEKIGGTAVILSNAGKRLSLPFNVSGHFLFMCSQMRDNIQTGSPHAKKTKEGAGGNAPKYYSSLTAEIKKVWSDTKIFEDPSDKKSKELGRRVQYVFDKTPNEKTGAELFVPVKYGLKGGVWRAYEAIIAGEDKQIITGKGNGYEFNADFMDLMSDEKIVFEPSFRGFKAIRNYFDTNPELVEFILGKARLLK